MVSSFQLENKNLFSSFLKIMNEEQESQPLSDKVSRGISAVDATVNLTIKISNSKYNPRKEIPTDISPSLISPSSSAFVSALQSPYISPRATGDDPYQENKIFAHPSTATTTATTTPTTFTQPSTPESQCGSHSDDMPSTSYTPLTERYDFSDPTMLKIVNCVPVPCSDSNTSNPTAPRISFSFPVPIPRISFAKGSVSPASSAKLRSCDVYIGFHGQNPNLIRFCKWLKSELELQGIACFVADRAKYADSQSHEIADRVICSVTFGIVVVTKHSILNHLACEEIRFFSQKKNLIPMFFGTDLKEVTNLLARNSDGKDYKEAIEWLMKSHEFKLESNEGNWRSSVSRAVGILSGKLGRKSVSNIEVENVDKFPFPKNSFFIGRQKELAEIETVLFGCKHFGENETEGGISADEESEVDKKRRSRKYKSLRGCVVCINGGPGIGKTELALEFAHIYSQRYKMVIWVGGEAQHLRQNLLNLSLDLGLDVSADAEKERGRIRSFDEQETEAFKRVKRELFREIPYLLIIDNLETENEWWEGKDLHDLIPGNTGYSHVIITTRLPKVTSFEPMQLQPLPLPDAMILMRGRRRKEYPSHEIEMLAKFDEKLKRSSFGLWVIGSLLSEMTVSPSALFQAINEIPLEEASSHFDEPFWGSNEFLLKVLIFCVTILHETKNHLALRMLLVGSWFAPSPVSANILAAAANHMTPSTTRFKKWAKCVNLTLFRCSGFRKKQTWKSEEDSALVLVNLGLARRTNHYPGSCILFHSITQIFAKRKGGLLAAKATIQGIRKIGNPILNSDHLWACAFLVFGFKTTPPLVQLKGLDMVHFIKKIALPLAIRAFTTFSRCNSALELLKVCTNFLEEVEKSFMSQIQDWSHGSLCWKKKNMNTNENQKIDEYVWQDLTLLKATLLETRAKLLLRGGHFDYGEELCRICISIRTVMLGHNHVQTFAAQETLSKLVRMRSKI